MDAAALRQALASFLGAERYRKFVKHLSYGQRMRYWQERAWSQFVCGHPALAVSEDELRSALRVCWVHGAELVPENRTVVGEVADYTGYAVRTRSEVYPCAEATAVLWTEGCPFPPHTSLAWYCPECRRAYAAEHPAPRRSIDWSRLADRTKGTS